MGRFAGTYSPDQYIITIGAPVGPLGLDLSGVVQQLLPPGFSLPATLNEGFAPGAFFSIAPDTASASKTVGATGEVTRARMLNRSAVATVTLGHAARANVLLSAYLTLFEEGINLTFPITAIDKNSNPQTSHVIADAWVQGWPEDGRSDAVGSYAWVIDCAEHKSTLGSYNR
jgi:hypothetical protein